MTPAAVATVHAMFVEEMRIYATAVFTQCTVFLMAMRDQERVGRIGCIVGAKSDAALCAELREQLAKVDCNGYVMAHRTWIGLGRGHSTADDDGSKVMALLVVTSYPHIRKMATAFHYNGQLDTAGPVIFNLDSRDLKKGDSMTGLMMDLLG